MADNNTYFNRFNSDVQPSDLAVEITAEECDNLGANKGLDGNSDNCTSFNSDLVPMLQQEVNDILTGNKNIFANEDSKCSENDKSPTHASMLSRILRFSQAVACVLCTYDPILSKLLKSGTYPQVLMGSSSGNYPQWRTPDTSPTSGSLLPVTSGGVYDAIQTALTQVWHVWTEYPEFSYYFDNTTDLNAQTGMTAGDDALVKIGEDGTNQIYSYNGSAWEAGDVLGVDDPTNFAVTRILKGYYADKELYYMKDSNDQPTWNILDATITELEDRMSALEAIYGKAVFSSSSSDNYLFGVKNTLSEALAVPATSGKTTITLVIGA